MQDTALLEGRRPSNEAIISEMRQKFCSQIQKAPKSKRPDLLYSAIVECGGLAELRRIVTLRHLECVGMGDDLADATQSWIESATRMAKGIKHA